ncbi:MAG: hypothetical protein ACI4HQ_14695 [Acetatifactor sp.]
MDVIFTPEGDVKNRHRDEEAEVILRDLCSDIPKTNAGCAQTRQIVEDRIANGEAIKKWREVIEKDGIFIFSRHHTLHYCVAWFCAERKDVIMSCPEVSDCIVVPSDSGATPSPVANIAINEEGAMSKEQIIESVKAKCRSLEKFAQPTRYEVETRIARTNAGKKDYVYYKKMIGKGLI